MFNISLTVIKLGVFLAGIKIIGGVSEEPPLVGEEEEERDFGVFIRRVLPGGLAAQDGRFLLPLVTAHTP